MLQTCPVPPELGWQPANLVRVVAHVLGRAPEQQRGARGRQRHRHQVEAPERVPERVELALRVHDANPP